MTKWKIHYYKNPQGKEVVFEFIQSFEIKTRSKIISTLALLEEYGTSLHMPYAKKLTGMNLWKLRVLGTNNLRIFYVAIVNKSFLLLHGFQKKKQKTEIREIKTAQNRLKEYLSRKS